MKDRRSARPFGYRSTVYGDESTPLIKVQLHELDVDEQLALELVPRYEDERSTLELKKHRDGLKPSEIGRLAELDALINEVRSNCRHRVFYDEAGFLYGMRYCACCGDYRGLV